jgi:hypothetical protein
MALADQRWVVREFHQRVAPVEKNRPQHRR